MNSAPTPTYLPYVKVTESTSKYRHLEKMELSEILANINNEDKSVPLAVEKSTPQILRLVTALTDKMLAGGRLFYLGAGTSGRLGVVDASECPPTFGVDKNLVIGLMAGGDTAIRVAVEKAEDDREGGWRDMQPYNPTNTDFVIGIAASGGTPYVVGALEMCKTKGILTGCITCNPGSPVAQVADFPIEVEVGPEFVTGSTRMKSGTAQKLVLNMITTTVMIQLGRVEDNKMVNMKLSNVKLVDRGTKMLMEKCNLTDYNEANKLLLEAGSVKKAMDMIIVSKDKQEKS
jgi:N-acetylmuramic acid 6-phosphate etherase